MAKRTGIRIKEKDLIKLLSERIHVNGDVYGLDIKDSKIVEIINDGEYIKFKFEK